MILVKNKIKNVIHDKLWKTVWWCGTPEIWTGTYVQVFNRIDIVGITRIFKNEGD